ncbi:cytochrome c biogenesis protein ResB [soil metagenome]
MTTDSLDTSGRGLAASRPAASRPAASRPGASARGPLERLADAAWRTLTSVRFAVLQIIVLVVAGLVGTMVRQIGSFALTDPAAYARELVDLHRRYDSLTLLGVNVGPGMVEVFDLLGFFRIFSAPWFTFLLTLLVVSIVVCTLDRTPRLWRTLRQVRVAQPDGFFDTRLPQRARLEADLSADELTQLLRSRRFRVRREVDGSAAFVYGDRNQYFRMATLLTHLGLILFLAGGAVTGALGYETVVFVGEGQTAPIQPVGTPGNLLVKNVSFDAPRRPDGTFADFRTDLAVYQNGEEIARKTIRVNDPLSVAGFVFHQNTFGPAAELVIHDPAGRLVWEGPLMLTDELIGRPQGFMTIPGSSIGLIALLDQSDQAASGLLVTGIAAGADRPLFGAILGLGGATDPEVTAGYTIEWRSGSAFTGMVVKKDPGQGLIWIAYLSLVAGLALTFYFPRRRVWARYEGGELRLSMLADRYVDVEREFDQLLDELALRAGRRSTPHGLARPAAPPG